MQLVREFQNAVDRQQPIRFRLLDSRQRHQDLPLLALPLFGLALTPVALRAPSVSAKQTTTGRDEKLHLGAR
jgi:hypothetical protein